MHFNNQIKDDCKNLTHARIATVPKVTSVILPDNLHV